MRERNTTASMNGRRFLASAFCAFRIEPSFFAFRFASRRGLSRRNSLPSTSRRQVLESPEMVPLQLLISTRYTL